MAKILKFWPFAAVSVLLTVLQVVAFRTNEQAAWGFFPAMTGGNVLVITALVSLIREELHPPGGDKT